MLGVTSYQEALRALGAELDRQAHETAGPAPTSLRLSEAPEESAVRLYRGDQERRISAAELQELVLASRARRGGALPHAPTPLADLLRSVGFALDDLHAVRVNLEVHRDALHVRFRDGTLRPRELTYAGGELAALREAAAARRKGAPLTRVLVLYDDPEAIGPLRELLVAEFAVQVLPWLYAPAVAQSGDPPEVILTRVAAEPRRALEALRALRASPRTASVPILVVAGEQVRLDAAAAFVAGADDVLQEPFTPAQLRARLRTCLLRRSPQSTDQSREAET